jgi:hypothetical protein
MQLKLVSLDTDAPLWGYARSRPIEGDHMPLKLISLDTDAPLWGSLGRVLSREITCRSS